MRDSPIRVRMPDELQELVASAAEREQLNRSAWVREVVTAASCSPLSLPEILQVLSADPPPQVNGHHRWRSPNPRLGATVAARSCLHRADLITRYPTFDRCACGWERTR